MIKFFWIMIDGAVWIPQQIFLIGTLIPKRKWRKWSFYNYHLERGLSVVAALYVVVDRLFLEKPFGEFVEGSQDLTTDNFFERALLFIHSWRCSGVRACCFWLVFPCHWVLGWWPELSVVCLDLHWTVFMPLASLYERGVPVCSPWINSLHHRI